MRLYSIAAVDDYLAKQDVGINIIRGCLCDTYVLYHPDAVEVFRERPMNQWSSAYSRHIYRKRIPKEFMDFVRESMEAETDTEEKKYLKYVLQDLEYAFK